MTTVFTASVQSLPDEIACGPSNELLVKSGILVLGDEGSQRYIANKEMVSFHDDFDGAGQAFGTTAIDGWLSRKGTTNAIDWTVTDGVNGTVVGKVGDTTASMAVSGVQLSRGLAWKANQGGLYVEARIKLGIITDIAFFFGLSDQNSALEMPIHAAASANTLTSNATDAVGFMFDTSMTDDKWWLVGVANNTDATHENTTTAPVADTYARFRIELSTAGVATFYYNGVAVGSAMTGAVTATVALTPTLAGFNRTTANGATTIFTMDDFDIGALRA
jgi:hypothetical protein